MEIKALRPRGMPHLVSLDEFQELGLLLEVNRRFLHPLGMALALVRDAVTGELVDNRVEIIDHRDDPEGIYFLEINQLKVQMVADLEEQRRPAREKSLGYWIQPVKPDGG